MEVRRSAADSLSRFLLARWGGPPVRADVFRLAEADSPVLRHTDDLWFGGRHGVTSIDQLGCNSVPQVTGA